MVQASFYQPSKERYKILIEDSCFPSDLVSLLSSPQTVFDVNILIPSQFALQSQVRWHGYDPDQAIVKVSPREVRVQGICAVVIATDSLCVCVCVCVCRVS